MEQQENKPRRPEFGSRVRATTTVMSAQRGIPKSYDRQHYYVESKHKSNPIEGIYIGYRTIPEGTIKWLGEEVGNVFVPTPGAYREVWLVVSGPRRNPVRVDPASVTVLEGSVDIEHAPDCPVARARAERRRWMKRHLSRRGRKLVKQAREGG